METAVIMGSVKSNFDVTVYLTSLKSLRHDMKRRCEELHISSTLMEEVGIDVVIHTACSVCIIGNARKRVYKWDTWHSLRSSAYNIIWNVLDTI